MTRKERFTVTALILFILFAFGLVGRIDRDPADRLTYDLTRCTPPDAKVSEIVTFVIKSTPDNKPTVTGCTRYALPHPIPTSSVVKR